MYFDFKITKYFFFQLRNYPTFYRKDLVPSCIFPLFIPLYLLTNSLSPLSDYFNDKFYLCISLKT